MSSGSADLGRAVLNILENLTVTDVVNENEVMRQLLVNKLLHVKITGPKGTPVYYQVSLMRGVPTKLQDGDYWVVKLDKDEPNYVTLPLNSYRAMEIWLGDTFLHRLNLGTSFVKCSGNSPANGFDLNLINVPQMGIICIRTDFNQRINISPVPHIMATIGPILYNDFVRVIPDMNDATRQMSMKQLVTLYRNEASLQIGITGLCFRNTYIGGAISILEKFGISTTTNDNDNDNDNENNNDNDNGNGNDDGNDDDDGNDNDNSNDNFNGNDNSNDNGNGNGNGNDSDNNGNEENN